MENSCRTLPRIGFQLFPPLSQLNELVRWNSFIAVIGELFASSAVIHNDRVSFTIMKEEGYLPKDGIYFREFSFEHTPKAEKIMSKIMRLACGFFPLHIVDLEDPKYTLDEKLLAYNSFISRTMKSNIQNREPVEHHGVCAYCLCTVTRDDHKLCGNCDRRSYCSSTCMQLDEMADGTGQGHSMWCSLSVCEEGLDWVVKAVPNKGKGVVAKRLIKSQTRIMVDRPRQITFPAVQDLEPLSGTLVEKECLNSFVVQADAETNSVLCLRVARINHSCNPNSSQIFDADMGVMIVVANRDIQEGEEISISYLNSLGRNSPHSPKTGRILLREKWDIECPTDCSCYDSKFQEELGACRTIHNALVTEADIVDRIDELLDRLGKLNVAWLWKMDALWDAFEILSADPSTIDLARVHGDKALELCRSIFHPHSDRSQEMHERIRNMGTGLALRITYATQSA
jgi:hypothetical protein